MKNFIQKFWYSFLLCCMLQTTMTFVMYEVEPVEIGQETEQQRTDRLERQRLDALHRNQEIEDLKTPILKAQTDTEQQQPATNVSDNTHIKLIKTTQEPTKFEKPFGAKVKDAIRSIMHFFSTTFYIKSIAFDAFGEYKTTNESYQQDSTAIDHIKEKFSDPKIKALDFAKKQEIVQALQDQANEFYTKETETMATTTSMKKGAVLTVHFQETCKQLVSAIEPMLTENQRLLKTFENGEFIARVVDLSTLNLTAQQNVPEALKDQLDSALNEYKDRLPEKFKLATSSEETALAKKDLSDLKPKKATAWPIDNLTEQATYALSKIPLEQRMQESSLTAQKLAAQILGLDPKTAVQATQALFLIAQIKDLINIVNRTQTELHDPRINIGPIDTTRYSASVHDKILDPLRSKIETLTRNLNELLSKNAQTNPYFKDIQTSSVDQLQRNTLLRDVTRRSTENDIASAVNALTRNCDNIAQALRSSLIDTIQAQTITANLIDQARQALLISTTKK